MDIFTGNIDCLLFHKHVAFVYAARRTGGRAGRAGYRQHGEIGLYLGEITVYLIGKIRMSKTSILQFGEIMKKKRFIVLCVLLFRPLNCSICQL